MRRRSDWLVSQLSTVIVKAREQGVHLGDAEVREEIRTLPDVRQAEALWRYWVQGQTQGAIAQAMRGSDGKPITQQAVSGLIKRGATNVATLLAQRAASLASHPDGSFRYNS